MLIKSLGKTILDQPSKQENTLALKTSLSHLPPEKQEEVAMIKDVILSHVKAELIILFGSYPTGKWVEDRYIEDGTTYEYKSDFDILVITKNRKVELGWGWPKINHKIIGWYRSLFQATL